MTTNKQATREAADRLRVMLPPGSTVFTVLRHVSRSGMSRNIDAYLITDNDRTWLSRLAARAASFTFNKKAEAIRMSGCGMDMGFALVYELSHSLYPDGFDCIGEACPSNDHSNGDRNREPHHHNDGGYALKQRWI